MYISTTSFPVGSVADQRLQNAMWHWNNVNGSRFDFSVGRDSDGDHGHNGVNEVLAAGVDGPNDTLAVTTTWKHCDWVPFQGWQFGIDETDVVFDAAESWTTASSYRKSGTLISYNFEGVEVDDIGQLHGLLHDHRK